MDKSLLPLVDDVSPGRMFAWAYEQSVREDSGRRHRERIAEECLRYCLQVREIGIAAHRLIKGDQASGSVRVKTKGTTGHGIPDIILGDNDACWELKIDAGFTEGDNGQNTAGYWIGTEQNWIIVPTHRFDEVHEDVKAWKTGWGKDRPSIPPLVKSWAEFGEELLRNMPDLLFADSHAELVRALVGFAENASAPVAPLPVDMVSLKPVWESVKDFKESASRHFEDIAPVRSGSDWGWYPAGMENGRSRSPWWLTFDPSEDDLPLPYWYLYEGSVWFRHPYLEGEERVVHCYAFQQILTDNWRAIANACREERLTPDEEQARALAEAAKVILCNQCSGEDSTRVASEGCCLWRRTVALDLARPDPEMLKSLASDLREAAQLENGQAQEPDTDTDTEGSGSEDDETTYDFGTNGLTQLRDAFLAFTEPLLPGGGFTWKSVKEERGYGDAGKIIIAVVRQFLTVGGAPKYAQNKGTASAEGLTVASKTTQRIEFDKGDTIKVGEKEVWSREMGAPAHEVLRKVVLNTKRARDHN